MVKAEVEWLDSAVYRGWRGDRDFENDGPSPSKCRSVGYVLQKTKDQIVLCQSQSDGANLAEVLVIPRKVVTKYKELK